MNTFKTFFKFEWKRFTCKRNRVIIAVFFAALLAVTIYNVNLYEKKNDQKKTLMKFEKKRVDHFISYRYYGNYGFRVSVKNEPMDIWSFGTAPFPDIQADVDSSERLKIYSPLQGAAAFSLKTKWFTDFSGIILLIGNILYFLYGFESYYHKKFLKFLASLAAERRVFLSTALARGILVVLLCLSTMLFSYVVAAVGGVVIPITWKLAISFLNSAATALFFFGMGAIFGQSKRMWVGLLAGGIIWFVSIFYLPAAIEMIVFGKANDSIVIHEIELEKLITLSDFEKRSDQIAGHLKYGKEPTNLHKELAVSYLRNEFKRILELDQNLIDQMAENVSLFKKLAMLFPTTNYLSVNYQLNTHGYKGLLEFYRKVKEVKSAFMNYYVDSAYTNKKTKVKPFLEDEEILFKYESQMTWEMFGGIGITLLLFLAFMTSAWKRTKRSIRQMPGKDAKKDDGADVKMKCGFITTADVYDDLLEKQIYQVFSGRSRELEKKGYTNRITLDGMELKDSTGKLDFLYLAHMKTFPGEVTAGAFLNLAAGLAKTGKERVGEIIEKNNIASLMNGPLKKLDADGLGKVFLALMDTRAFEHYLLCDVTLKMTVDFAKDLKERLDHLTAQNRVNVVFLTSDFMCNSLLQPHGHHYDINSTFFNVLGSLKRKLPKPGAPGESGDKTDGGE